jgi:predicted transcriptional regulator
MKLTQVKKGKITVCTFITANFFTRCSACGIGSQACATTASAKVTAQKGQIGTLRQRVSPGRVGQPENLSDNVSDILYEQERRSQLPILKAPPKQPKTVTVQARVEESVKTQLERYAEFIDASPSYVITEALKLLFRKDDEFRRWADLHANNHNNDKAKGDVLAKAV